MGFKKHYFEESTISLDLKKYYDDLNEKYFDNELPDIPVKYVNSKKAGGWVDAVINKKSGNITIKGLAISKFFKRDEDNFIQILLHEMIHVWLNYNNILERNPHGIRFKTKCREIENKSGIKIPERDSISSVVSDDIKSKKFDVLFIKQSDNKYSIGVFKKGFFDNFFDGFEYSFKTLKRRYPYPIFIIQSDDRQLLKYPTQRTKKKISFYIINKDDAKRIIDNGKMIYNGNNL